MYGRAEVHVAGYCSLGVTIHGDRRVYPALGIARHALINVLTKRSIVRENNRDLKLRKGCSQIT